MAPFSAKECITLLASFTDFVPFVKPAAGVLLMIAEAVEGVSDNNNQCFYLLRRSTDLCFYVNHLYSDNILPDHYRRPVEELKGTLEGIRWSIISLSKITPLRRFLQRHDISDSIKDSHKSLDRCIELFNLTTASGLAFVAAEHETARQKDQAQLGRTLEQLLDSNANILESLELRGDQLLEAIHGLRDAISRGIDDSMQERFATTSLKTLSHQQQPESRASQIVSFDWAVSSLEIFIENEIVGRGAFGTVHVGRWNGTRVAVKQLAKGTPQQILIQEIDIWRRLHHPHVASFFRASIESNPPLLVSELYIFGNAIEYLSKFPQANRVNMCYEISLGMAFLHNEKVIHGDLKPANVLIDDSHHARITDFGLSRVKTSLTTASVVSDAGGEVESQTTGTRAFMAPERLRRGTMTFATDVYAFSMSVYQLMTDEAPFQHLPDADIFRAVAEHCERPERPEGQKFVARGLTSSMWRLMQRCWVDDRQQRPRFTAITAKLESLNNRMASFLASLEADSLRLKRNLTQGRLSSPILSISGDTLREQGSCSARGPIQRQIDTVTNTSSDSWQNDNPVLSSPQSAASVTKRLHKHRRSISATSTVQPSSLTCVEHEYTYKSSHRHARMHTEGLQTARSHDPRLNGYSCTNSEEKKTRPYLSPVLTDGLETRRLSSEFRHEGSDESSGLAPALDISPAQSLPGRDFEWPILLTVHSAQDLPGKSLFSTPDPFAVVMVDNVPVNVTSVEKKTVNPQWEQQFEIILSFSSMIKIVIFDNQRSRKNKEASLGATYFPLLAFDFISDPPKYEPESYIELCLVTKNSRMVQGRVMISFMALGPPRPQATSPLGPLPEGWEIKILKGGLVTFVDQDTKTTTWNDPRLSNHEEAW